MVIVRFALTRSEVDACHRRLQARRWRHWVLICTAIAIAVVGVVERAADLIVFGAAYALFYSTLIWLIAPRIIWRRSPQLRAEQAVHISDAGIRADWTNVSTSADWTFWRTARLIDDVYVLQARQRGYCMVPRRAFESPLQEQRFRELVATRLGESVLRVASGRLPSPGECFRGGA